VREDELREVDARAPRPGPPVQAPLAARQASPQREEASPQQVPRHGLGLSV
jgi:hypothetical protein